MTGVAYILGLEESSTPTSTPGPSTKRRISQPISLNIHHKQGDWTPRTELTDIDVPMPNHSISPPEEDSVSVPFARLPQLQGVTSPCFVHSHLDKGMMLADWFKNKRHSAEVNDVGLAKSLQSTGHINSSSHPSAISDLDRKFGTDEDESGNTLTKRLAETAVTVREMSKQLGRARIRSNIQTVLVVTKARDNRLIKLTRQLALYLMLKRRPGSTRGLIVYVDSQLRQSKRFAAEGLKRDYPELFIPFPKSSPSTHSLSSLSSNSTHTEHNGEGQLRYWTSDMCRHNPHWFDFVVTLGGDGTVLFTSWLFQKIVPPVLSFSLGSLGFLTNFDFANHEADMASAIDDGIRVNLRMRFTCTVYRAVNQEDKQRKAVRKGDTGEIMMKNIEEGGWEALEGGWAGGIYGDCKKDKEIMCFTTRPVETFEVLNDLVVDRGPSPYVSLLELFGDEHHMTTVQADGLTIATPTGSTAYSLSAGGSLVHPEIPAILITPICPHTLSFRPMLLPDTLELRICVPYNSRSTAWASFDGRGRVELKQGDHIKVTASRYPFPSVCADKQSTDWFHAISRTLKWNERERQKSFVVVEEDAPPKPRRQSKPKRVDMHSAFDDEDEDEVTDDEEEKFDIDDSAPEADATTDGAQVTAMDHAIGIEKTQGKLLQTKGRTKSRSRSRNRTSAPPWPLPSGVVVSPNRYATKPPRPTSVPPRHVGFDVSSPASSASSDSLVSDAAHEGTRDDLRSPRLPSGKSRIPKDRNLDLDHVKTPTTGQHDHRAFAVWGQDGSDSATSDNDS